MNNSTLYGEEYSHLIPLLLFKEGNGTVHSRFTNGFNIKMGNSLIFIGTTKNGRLPFGIHVNETDNFIAVSSVSQGEQVHWNETTKSLEFNRISISLEKSNPYKNELLKLENEQLFERKFQQFSTYIMNIQERTGLNISIREFMNIYPDFDVKDTRVESYLVLLVKAAMTNDDSLMDKAFRYFLGRGNGLTPSGDDMIVGLLSFDAVSPFLSPPFYDKLSHLIESESITTDVAKEYLRYALEGEFSSTVSNMVNALVSESGNVVHFEKNLQELLGVGHSSGLDTLFGILLGILTFKELNNKTEFND